MEAIFILFFYGYGITAVSLSNKLSKEKIWLSFWTGTILIAAYTPALSFGRIPLTLGIYVIALLALPIFIYSLFRKASSSSYQKIELIILLFILIVSLFLLSLNLSGLKNIINDLMLYTLKHPLDNNLNIFQAGHYIGIYSIIDFFATVLKQKIVLIANILPTIYLIGFCPLIFILLRKIFSHKNPFIILILTSILLLIFYIIFDVCNLSLDQLIFTGVILFIFIIFFDNFPNILRTKPDISNTALCDVLLAISLFSLSVIYPPWFKIIFVLFLIIILFSLFFKRNINLIFFLVKIFFLMIIINPIIMNMAFHIK